MNSYKKRDRAQRTLELLGSLKGVPDEKYDAIAEGAYRDLHAADAADAAARQGRVARALREELCELVDEVSDPEAIDEIVEVVDEIPTQPASPAGDDGDDPLNDPVIPHLLTHCHFCDKELDENPFVLDTEPLPLLFCDSDCEYAFGLLCEQLLK